MQEAIKEINSTGVEGSEQIERGVEQPVEKVPTAEEKLAELGSKILAIETALAKRPKSDQDLANIRAQFGEGDWAWPKSRDQESAEKLEKEKADLEKEQNELEEKQEKERLFKEFKEQVIREKIGSLLEEFIKLERLSPQNFESVRETGVLANGENFESAVFGKLDPEVARGIAEAKMQVKGAEGIDAFHEFIKKLPDFMKKIDEEAIHEANRRVEQYLTEMAEKSTGNITSSTAQ